MFRVRSIRFFCIAVMVLGLSSLATSVRAEPGSAPPERERYGLWIAAVDVAMTAVFLGGAAAEQESGGDSQASVLMMAGGLIGYMFASPIVHGLHGRKRTALGSFFLHSTGPLLTMAVAGGVFGCGPFDSGGCELAAPIGLLAGAFAVTTIDAVWLARRPARRDRRLTIQPVMTVSGDRRLFGLAGRF